MWLKAFVVLLSAFLAYRCLKTDETPDLGEVAGMRVVVTGASSGIGEEIAYQLARNGARLVVTARTASKLKRVVSRCKELGSPEAHYIAVGMNSFENASSVIEKAMKEFGGIDMLVLNHLGQTYFGGYRYNVADVERLLMSNTLTHAHMATIAMDTLKENRGRVVVTSSAVALAGGPYVVPYATTKFALNGFFASLRHELIINNTDVTISVCHIGYIATQSALKVSKYLHEKPSPKEDCAAAMINGALARSDDVYHPEKMTWVNYLKPFFPSYINQAIRDNYHDVY